MSRYVTISVPISVKRRLEKLKGDMDWGKFLLMLCEEYEKFSRKQAFEELVDIIDDDELRHIEKAMLEFRKKFKLRG
ncbi:MAG: antitoxin VapB family protein [Candidatus Njordarchaeota archaeon]